MAPSATAGGPSFGELYSKCVQMVNENKISAKNAFDLHLIDHMDDIVDSFMGGRKRKAAEKAASSGTSGGGRSSKATSGQSHAEAEEENRFHEASCTIEASARIYACRVDCVHTDTYRVLGGLSSADMDDDEDKDGEKGDKKRRRICGVNTLERNEANIIQQSIEADEQSDPMFRRMAAAFDAGGAKGLLLAHLPVAEDLSLVFNGDVPLNRASQTAKPLFQEMGEVSADKLGLGEAAAACAKLSSAKLCPAQLDSFRRQLWGGDADGAVSLPKQLEALLGPQGQASLPAAAGIGHAPSSSALQPIMDGEMPGLDAPPPDLELELDPMPFEPPEPPATPAAPLPLTDAPMPGMGMLGDVTLKLEDVDAFNELFEKFCEGGGTHQFASFEKDEPSVKKEGKQSAVVLADSTNGALVPVPEDGQVQVQEGEKKPARRPAMDIAALSRPIKPIETEPAQKHQLGERAARWQLQKDVPPYMIDRITMPSWQAWSKHDFACLGMRPHLMLKLMKKSQPEGEGAQGFSDLYSTVLVENPDAFPWLSGGRASASSRSRGDEDDDAPGRGADMADDGAEEGFDSRGLPAHLDVDPQELFLRPEDTVIPGMDQEDGDYGDMPDLGDDGFGGDFPGSFGGGGDAPFMPGLDFDLADRPKTVGSTDIGYSRNSKFVDVKLVKKHLWDCINEKLTQTKAQPKQQKEQQQTSAGSFQGLVDKTVQRMPKGETENLSVAVCFICALHLCNEKGLELEVDKSRLLGDFKVTGPP